MKTNENGVLYECPKIMCIDLTPTPVCVTSAENSTLTDVDYVDYGEI